MATAKLGAEVRLFARVGDDLFGKNLIDNIASYGVDASGILVTPGAHTGVAVITLCGGENTIIVDPGANDAMMPEDCAFHELPDALVMQMEIPYATVHAAARSAMARGVKVFLNPAPAPSKAAHIPQDFFQGIFALTPNESECEAITGARVTDEGTAYRALDALRRLGVDYPVITLGAEGAAFWDGAHNRRVPAIPVQAVDTTAAGDTFTAALAVAVTQGASIAEGVDFARRAAAITVSRRGAQDATPTRKEMEGERE